MKKTRTPRNRKLPLAPPAAEAPAHGGAREGAGRPAGIAWSEVERFANAGAPENEIIKALGITEVMLQDRETGERFRSSIERGHARYRLWLREEIKRRGSKTTKNAGSVNALALQARNHLDWDRQSTEQQAPPDLAGARERLRDTFLRLAAARTEAEGRPVTPAELVYRETFGAGAGAEHHTVGS